MNTIGAHTACTHIHTHSLSFSSPLSLSPLHTLTDSAFLRPSLPPSLRYDTARDYEQRWSIKVSTTRLFTLSWSHDSRFVAMGGLDKRAFVVDVADAEVRTTFVGEPGDELGVITCVSFSRSSTMLAVTTNLGRVYFVPTRPFGTRGTVNALRAKARLINLSASFAKSLNWLNAAAPWVKPGKAGERGQTGATRAGRWAPSRNGATALHLLADMHTSGDFWGNSPAKSQQVNEPVVTTWADADVPYFPVCNADGATPLEVAVAAKNHLFTSYLLDREKGTKGVMWNTDPTWKHAASFRPDLITARDLSMLLEWPSALGYAVQVGLCSRFGQSWRSGITWRRLPRWYAHNSTQRAHSSPPSLP